MSVPTAELTAPAVSSPNRIRAAGLPGHLSAGRLYLVLGGCAVLIGALSLLVPSTPSYDPWAWLVWGREIVHFKLHTTGGPSWKPLPVIFTSVFALFGKASPDLWLVVARAGAVVAAAMTFKIAWRITRQLTRFWNEASGIWTWLPALLAGLISAGSLINSRGFITDNALGYSEGLMTALVLMAIDSHLDGKYRQAFAIGFAAALDRPELWFLWGPYGLYLWWRDPGARKLVAALFGLIPVLWFLPELWGSGHLFRGVTRAQHVRSNSPALTKCPFCTEFGKHAWPTVLQRVKAIGLAAMAVAAFGLWRALASLRSGAAWTATNLARAALLAAGAVGFGWWIGISLETQAGFSGNDRYLVLGVALVSVTGGVGWGWAAGALAALTRRPGRLRRSITPAVAVAGGVVLATALFIAFPPWIGTNLIDVQRTHRALVYQSHLRQDLAHVVSRLGPPRILSCGSVMTEGFQVPMLAWDLGVHTVQVEASPASVARPGAPPNVIFQARAQRSAHLLPVVRVWEQAPYNVHYTLVAHVRTFRVYANCAGRVTL